MVLFNVLLHFILCFEIFSASSREFALDRLVFVKSFHMVPLFFVVGEVPLAVNAIVFAPVVKISHVLLFFVAGFKVTMANSAAERVTFVHVVQMTFVIFGVFAHLAAVNAFDRLVFIFKCGVLVNHVLRSFFFAIKINGAPRKSTFNRLQTVLDSNVGGQTSCQSEKLVAVIAPEISIIRVLFYGQGLNFYKTWFYQLVWKNIKGFDLTSINITIELNLPQ
jgi:hypothetical protein